MIGYIYKTTNKITGEYYIGKREYRKDLEEHEIYLGSGKYLENNIQVYGRENFTKEILEECDTLEELAEREKIYIERHFKDDKCLNASNGIKWGGIYMTGVCPKCSRNTVLYSNSGLCMNCILGETQKYYCPECDRETYHYKSGKCMSCVSKQSHSKKWCEFCQEETSHFGNLCKNHKLYLVKNNGKIELHIRNGHDRDRVLFDDVLSLLDNMDVIKTPKSTIYNLPKGMKSITCNNSLVGLKSVLYNENVSDWLKISYRYSPRKDQVRSITVTTDHPLPTPDGRVLRADQFTVGDQLVRVNPKMRQWETAEIISIESVEYTGRSYDVTTETEYFDINQDILSHNCRSFLSPYLDENGNEKHYGRLNQGVVTINLVDVALSANKEFDHMAESVPDAEYHSSMLNDIFWRIFDERLELCHKALQIRHQHLEGTPSDVSPIHWQYGALARLKKGETIDKLLHGGYSTISLGYAGLYECVKAITGLSHTDPMAKDFAIAIMEYMNHKCEEWKKEENVGYSVYGTPIEQTTEKFAKCLQKRFGRIEGITDHDYITNSYHVNVREHIDPFTKLKFESEFQKLSSGGCISYIETSNLDRNVDAVLEVIKYIYDNTMYAELNTKSDYCTCCGYDGEIKIVTDKDGKLVWECPNCGNRDQRKMSVARRTCGYIGSNYFNQGRTEEIRDRYVHLGNND